jgi:signal transduction histidine kinase
MPDAAHESTNHAGRWDAERRPEQEPKVEELTSALAAHDSFLGTVAHELRNSIAPQLLLAETLTMAAPGPAAPDLLASRAAMLTRQINKLITTIDRVSEVADLRRGRIQLAPVPVELTAVVDEVCREARREAAAAGAELVAEAAGPVVGAWDRARLKQIIGNLVSNAIRYAGGGRIELTITERGDDAVLVVRDHGRGIDPGLLPALFDRLERDRPRTMGGFGIGLWVVKMLCQAMGGSVTADNVVSGGARFSVVLPRG